jgi:hypothetical protein
MRVEEIPSGFGTQLGKIAALFAEDIAKLIGASHATVNVIKADYGMPLPLKKVGNRCAITIYDVADWPSIFSSQSISDSTSAEAATTKTLPELPTPTTSSRFETRS